MATGQERLDRRVVRGDPIHVDLVAVNIDEDRMRQVIIVLIVINDKNFDLIVVHVVESRATPTSAARRFRSSKSPWFASRPPGHRT